MGLDELILVVPRGRLLPPGGLDGFFAGGVDAYVERIRRHGEFRRRADVEEDPSLKQIIPYLIIRHRDRIFLFQRSTRGGGGGGSPERPPGHGRRGAGGPPPHGELVPAHRRCRRSVCALTPQSPQRTVSPSPCTPGTIFVAR